MLHHFAEGYHSPSQFFVEPALSYCQQFAKKGDRESSLDKAEKNLQRSLEKGYEPAWNLLLQGWEEEPVLDALFESFCLKIMNPIRNMANEK